MLGIELAGGALIFALFLVVMLFVFAHALYSKTGSGIDYHTYGNPYDAASGARHSHRRSGREGMAHWTHGTR